MLIKQKQNEFIISLASASKLAYADVLCRKQATQTLSHTTKQQLPLPDDLHKYPFAAFAEQYFKGHIWHARREPIASPFLTKDDDSAISFEELLLHSYPDEFAAAVDLFKLVLRYMHDVTMSTWNEIMLADYIVMLVCLCKEFKCNNVLIPQAQRMESLRDELWAQLINQTYMNDERVASERAWMLMAIVSTSVRPSQHMINYALK